MKKDHKKIEVRRRREYVAGGGYREVGDLYDLLIDGAVLEGVTVGENYKSSSGLPNFHVGSELKNASKQIVNFAYAELRQARIESVICKNWTRWVGFDVSVIFGRDHKSRRTRIFELEFDPDLVNWNYHYSYNDYYLKFKEIYEKQSDERYMFGVGGVQTKFMLQIEIPSSKSKLLHEMKTFLKRFTHIHEQTLSELGSTEFSNSILARFQFPEELKVSCEQYLLYFAQFLHDLGIDATSTLKENAGHVLFSVTPADGHEALGRVREALAMFLNLPSSPVVYDDSVKSIRLKQQIGNLQHSQKMAEMEFRLAHKVIESQDKIIEEKNLTIEQQSKVIEMIANKSLMIDSAENKEELEELFEGVKVGQSKFLAEQLGIHLNPATALKSIGKKLIGKEGITSLNLDDDENNI